MSLLIILQCLMFRALDLFKMKIAPLLPDGML